MRVKTCAAQIKSTEQDSKLKAGEFEAIVSAFGNTDAVGDVVLPGAFTNNLKAWEESGNPIPVIWSHDHGNPDAHIGVVQESKEIDAGLWVKGLLDIGEPFAKKVYNLMKSRRVTKFSFAYDMKDYEENDQGGFNLKELDVWEVGPTLIPANDATDLLSIKNLMVNEGFDMKELAAALRGVKAGRVLSAKNVDLLTEAAASLSIIQSNIKTVLESAGAEEGAEDDSKAQDDKPADDPEKPAESNGSDKEPEETKPAPKSKPAGTPSAGNVNVDLTMLLLEADTF